MEQWFAENALKLLGTIAAVGYFLIQLGEWKARVQERRRREEKSEDAPGVVASAIELAISAAARTTKHDAVTEIDKKLGVPVWKELNRLRDDLDQAKRDLASHGERIARLEPRK